ncbi:MAG: class IV adenylate cyclase [Candidatus Diapherotrites archaeon]|nr:class IV adenylate cyclase [Candidatus Diapherotrites archaeon]
MREIEAKILEVNTPRLVKKLKALGAKKNLDEKVTAFFYDFPGRKLHNQKSMLRLRKKGKIVELTFKKRVSKAKAKISEEIEVNVPDFSRTQKILESIGLRLEKISKKHRLSYNIEKTHFEFDTFKGIPTFLEIEAPSEKVLEKYVKLLGFKASDAKAWTGKEVLDYYANKAKPETKKQILKNSKI